LTKEAKYNAVNVAVYQEVWLGRILIDFEQIIDMLTKALIESKFEQYRSTFGVTIFESRGVLRIYSKYIFRIFVRKLFW
jgi:hypothetical protein